MLLVLLLAFLLFYLVICFVFYPLFLCPLRHIPAAHWTARFSSLWILYRRWLSRQNATIYAAHEMHGSVVLLSPHELTVNCVANGLRTIYGGGFDKDDFYSNSFPNYSTANMFSTAQSAPHSHRKRMISNIYSKTSIQTSSTFSSALSEILLVRLIPKLLEQRNTSINAKWLFEAATMDIVTAYLFGLDISSDFLRHEDDARLWFKLYQSRRDHDFWPAEFPNFHALCKWLGLNLTPPWIAHANDHLEAWTLRMCDAAEQQVICWAELQDSDEKKHSSVYAQLYSELEHKQDKNMLAPESVPRRMQVASEMHDHLSAGHETSAITLNFLFHELSLRPSVQSRLREELRSLSPKIKLEQDQPLSSDLPDAKPLDALPLLHAVVMETLRLHAAIPGPEPRVTPPRPSGVTLGEFPGVPGGVRVSCSAWCLHRNRHIFPSPEAWIPERWLPDPTKEEAADKARIQEQLRWFWAFSSGGRMCIGSHLAMAQMKAITACLVACFEIQREAPMKDTGGAEPFELQTPYLQEDAYTAQPLARELMLRFIPIEA